MCVSVCALVFFFLLLFFSSFCLMLHICVCVYVCLSSPVGVPFSCSNVVAFVEIVLFFAFQSNVLSGGFHAFLRSLCLRSCFIYIVQGMDLVCGFVLGFCSVLLSLFCYLPLHINTHVNSLSRFFYAEVSCGEVHLVGVGIFFNFHVLFLNFPV